MPSADRRYGKTVRIDDDAKEKLIKYAQRTGMKNRVILNTLIDMCDQFDLLSPDWTDRINAALAKGSAVIQRSRLQEIEKCDGLRKADGKHKCIQGRPDKTPMIRILSEDLDEALDLCEGCTLTKDPILQNIEYQKRITVLEMQLKAKSDFKLKAPVCERGAVLDNDGTAFKGCPRSSNPVSIKNFCMILKNGLPCGLFRTVILGVGKKEV
jgi:hypothetical protein